MITKGVKKTIKEYYYYNCIIFYGVNTDCSFPVHLVYRIITDLSYKEKSADKKRGGRYTCRNKPDRKIQVFAVRITTQLHRKVMDLCSAGTPEFLANRVKNILDFRTVLHGAYRMFFVSSYKVQLTPSH